MKTIAQNIRLQYTESGNTEIVLTTKDKVDIADLREAVNKGKQISVEVKVYRRSRSLDSNSYCWVLCQKIAEVIRSTKELVYQQFIKQVGQFEIVPIKAEAVPRWLEVWKGKGLGWFAEVLEDSKLPGYKKVISYYGSSVYDQREMGLLIDEIVSQCKELNIETLPESELNSLKSSWGN